MTQTPRLQPSPSLVVACQSPALSNGLVAVKETVLVADCADPMTPCRSTVFLPDTKRREQLSSLSKTSIHKKHSAVPKAITAFKQQTRALELLKNISLSLAYGTYRRVWIA